MEKIDAHLPTETIYNQNIFAQNRFDSFTLGIYLPEVFREYIETSNQTPQNRTYYTSARELEHALQCSKFDAAILYMDRTLLGCDQFLNNFCANAQDIPIVAIGPSLSQARIEHIFNAGIQDFIPLDELGPKNLRRVVSYAVVRNQNMQQIRAFEKRHRGIIQNATEGIFQTTPQGTYILANPALANLYGFSSPEDLVQNLTNISTQLYIDPNRRVEFANLMRLHDKVSNFESQIRRKNGDTIWISENARAVRDANGDIIYYEGFVRDITQRRENEIQLRFLAQRDPLTGLPNRALYKDSLLNAIVEAKATETKIAVLFIDLDNFKAINDTLGHPIGDKVLQTVAQRLGTHVKQSDMVARLSGDEFAIILHRIADDKDVRKVAKRVLDALSTPMTIEGKVIYTSGSIGASIYPDNGVCDSELMRNVDTAAYHAKKKGKNAFSFYNENLSTQARRRLAIENGLRLAIEKDQLTLHFQPKICLKNRTVNGCEALLRWTHDEFGPVSPDEFIPIAEESGLIVKIGNWVIEQACKHLSFWLNAGLTPGRVAINISARQFTQSDLITCVKGFLDQYQVPAHCLELELTETTLVEHLDRAVSLLKEFADLGIKSSIDDFGTGYSSLSYLKKFPISTLKIDRSFINDIPHDKDDVAIAKTIISLAKGLDLNVVAEGIENKEQCDFLTDLGCELAQGYYFSKPVDADAFTKLLEK